MSLPLYSHVGHLVAREVWVCCECGGHIRPDAVYERHAGVWEAGQPLQRHRTCIDCEEARDWLVNETGWVHRVFCGTGIAFIFGYLRQHLLDQAKDGERKDRIPALRLVVAMNRRRKAAGVTREAE